MMKIIEVEEKIKNLPIKILLRIEREKKRRIELLYLNIGLMK
jgi:hypothetical protein